MEVNKTLKVIDKTDKKEYPCKIVETDDVNRKIKVHFLNWSERHDEWLDMNSDRILMDSEPATHESSSSNVKEVPDPIKQQAKEIIGKLLMNSDEIQKKVISEFEYDVQQSRNEKNLNKFQVQMLEDTAEYLKIEVVDCNNKKLYNKNMLTKKILNKVCALLPVMCSDCESNYSIEIGEQSYFSCAKCDRGSHNCDSLKEFHASLPKIVPIGFLWLCSTCRSDITPEKALSSLPASSEIPQTENESADRPLNGNLESNNGPSAAVPAYRGPVTPKDGANIKMCNLYKKGICPHGLTGNKIINEKKCSFAHPRACRNYTAYGSRDPRGCNPGSNYKYYHPILCRYSVKSCLCSNEKCTFVHLKGTKRNKTEEPSVTIEGTPKNKSGYTKSHVPKNDPIERLEKVIMEMKKVQEAEMNAIRLDLDHFKSLNLHSPWGSPPQWYSPQPQSYQNPMPMYHNWQNSPVQPQIGMYQRDQRSLGVSQLGQQMRGAKPEAIGVLPSCC